MCAPPALAAAAAVVSAAGTVMGGMQANAMGKYQQRIAQQNAAMSAEAARDSIDRGRDENRALGRRVGAVKGQQAAAMAANGVDLSYGSAARTQEDTAMMAREDQDALMKNIEQRTRGFDIQGWNETAKGDAARYHGKQALIGSMFQAGSTLLSSASDYKLQRTKLGKSGWF